MQRSTDHILSLDLCRGFAALCVMFYHISFLFSATLQLFPRGYLCVDFFFLLSGYVIAKSYDTKFVNGLTLGSFLVRRIARLWPLVLLSTAIGFVVQLMRFRQTLPDLSSWDLAVSLASNLLMLPSPTSPNDFLFPFNAAAWSISFELLANLIYVATFRYLIGTTLGLLILGSAFALALTAVAFNSLDLGMTQGTFVLGFPRVLFSFFLGVFLFRHTDNLWKWPTRGASPFLLGLLGAAALVAVPKIQIDYVNGLLDLCAVVLVFPLLLRVAEGAKLSAGLNRLAWFLGGTSYSVYLLQTPLMIGFSALPQVFLGQKIAAFTPWAGVVFTLVLAPIAYICWTYFERPAQRWITKTMLTDEVKGRLSVTRGSADPAKQYTPNVP